VTSDEFASYFPRITHHQSLITSHTPLSRPYLPLPRAADIKCQERTPQFSPPKPVLWGLTLSALWLSKFLQNSFVRREAILFGPAFSNLTIFY
jgi:hypothetical protein